MNPNLKNFLAVIAGVVVGSIVNMGLIFLGHAIVPPPEGFEPMDFERMAEMFAQFEAKHFIMPFFAHAIGTLVGAFTAAKIAATHNMIIALVIGVWFMYGGVTMIMDYPSPMWFNVLDLVVAYIPMGYLGWKLSGK